MKTYILNPNMTFKIVATPAAPHKPADRATEELVNALLPEALLLSGRTHLGGQTAGGQH